MNAEQLDVLVQRTQKGDKQAFVELLVGVQKEVRVFLSAHASSVDMVEVVATLGILGGGDAFPHPQVTAAVYRQGNSMTDEAITVLIEGYLEGCLTSQERESLAAMVRADSDLCEQFADQVRLHIALDACLRHDTHQEAQRRADMIVALNSTERDKSLLQSVERRIGAGSVPSQSKTLGRRLAWAAAAAVVLAVLGLGVFQGFRDRPSSGEVPPLAHLSRLQGEVWITSTAGKIPAREGQELLSGQGLTTGEEDSSAVVLYPDGTRLEVGPETTLSDISTPANSTADDAGKKVLLVGGSLLAQVTPQPAGRPILLATPHAEVLASETKLHLSSGTETTHVELEEGAVRLLRKRDRLPVDMKTGQSATITSSLKAPWSQPLPPRRGRPHTVLAGHADAVTALAFSPQGRTVATGGNDKQIKLWSLPGGGEESSLTMRHGDIGALLFSPDGQTLAVAIAETVELVDVAAGKVRPLRDARVFKPPFLAFSPDGKMLAVARRGNVSLCKVAEAELRATLKAEEPRDPLGWLSFSADGSRLTAWSLHAAMTRWRTASGEFQASVAFPPAPEGSNRVRLKAVSPDGKSLVLLDGSTILRLWDQGAKRFSFTLHGHQRKIEYAVFSPDSRFLATGGKDLMVKVWEIATGRELVSFEGHEKRVTALAFSPDSTLLASGSADHKVRLWELPGAVRP